MPPSRPSTRLVPAMFDCSKIDELGIDKQENHRAGAIMIFCGRAEGGKPSPAGALSKFAQDLLPLYGAGDVNLITGTETSPNVVQSETFTTANPDNPQQIVVAYNDSRGRNANPINISGASVSTDGGTTFTRLTASKRSKPLRQYVWRPCCSVPQPNRHLVHRLAGRRLRRSGPRRVQVHHSLGPE